MDVLVRKVPTPKLGLKPALSAAALYSMHFSTFKESEKTIVRLASFGPSRSKYSRIVWTNSSGSPESCRTPVNTSANLSVDSLVVPSGCESSNLIGASVDVNPSVVPVEGRVPVVVVIGGILRLNARRNAGVPKVSVNATASTYTS